jgi:hypothetical protein
VARKQFAAAFVVLLALAVGLAIAAGSRGDGKPSQRVRPALVRGAGDDNADVMRRLQRDERARAK